MDDRILMAHGNGGKFMSVLINEVIAEIFGTEKLQLDDSAILKTDSSRIAFTTDTYTITPIFFHGGDIGKLAVNGTVNDLSVMGADPLFLSCGIIIEEGFSVNDLKKILNSMKTAADYAGVSIVTGDTKVVEKGSADKIFINTSGIGIMGKNSFRSRVSEGDLVIINGTVGEHGMSIMAERNDLSFSHGLSSDSAPLNHLLKKIGSKFPGSISFARDATRGGVASVLNEIVSSANFGLKIVEKKLPFKDEVRGISEILGIDPLYSANEGKVILIVKRSEGERIVSEMKKIKEGVDSAIIGEITDKFPGKVYMETSVGGNRIIPPLEEDQLPRIC